MTNNIIKLTITLLLSISLLACGSTPESDSGEAQAQVTESASSATSAETTSAGSDSSAASTEAEQAAAPPVEPEEVKPAKIVESCKDEPYGKYEKQARGSINKGLAATKAEKFGVGFRSVAEHNQWSKTHNSLFKSVNSACDSLAKCAKKNKKDKGKKCASQAKTFAKWQSIAKSFAAKAKMAERTQPPKICSMKPNLDDAADCFHQRGKDITDICDSDACKAVSDCWRGVGFLDGAITQATQSCGFVHQKLKDCRGYTEATTRRKNKFAQCMEMQESLNITIFPVL